MKTTKGKIWEVVQWFGGITFLLGLVWTGAMWYSSIDSRTFDSPEQKVVIIKEVMEGPTAEQKQRDRILDSINKESAIKSRALRDSTFKKIQIYQRKSDSLYREDLLKLHDQVYQIKETLKKQ